MEHSSIIKNHVGAQETGSQFGMALEYLDLISVKNEPRNSI